MLKNETDQVFVEVAVVDPAVDHHGGIALLDRPGLRRGELCEALHHLGFVHAGPDVVHVPLHRLLHLGMGQADALEAVADGAAQLLVAVAAKAEMGETVHAADDRPAG
jgi:hypothetical protein